MAERPAQVAARVIGERRNVATKPTTARRGIAPSAGGTPSAPASKPAAHAVAPRAARGVRLDHGRMRIQDSHSTPNRVKVARSILYSYSALLLAGSSGNAAFAAESLSRIADVRALSREEATKAQAVRIRGVVTWRGLNSQLTVQDDSAGIWIGVGEEHRNRPFATASDALGEIRVGQLVEIDGVTKPGGYAPVVLPQSIRVVGEQALPPARPMLPESFFNGADDCFRVEVRGVVQGFQSTGSAWLLNLHANPGSFIVQIPQVTLRDPGTLVDAKVRLTGVAITDFNTRGEFIMPRVNSSGADELVVESAGTPPFAAPRVRLDQLLAFRPKPIGPHRLRVEGVVTFASPGKFLYLQDGNRAVRVETSSMEKFDAGDRVEASGFVTMTRHVGALAEAHVRRIDRGAAPAAVPVRPDKIIAMITPAMASGDLASHDFDGHLVRFDALLLAVQSGIDARQPWRRLTLQSGEMILSAILQSGEMPTLDGLLPGSLLEITGIVQLEYTPVKGARRSLMPTRLDVLLRHAADVRVARAPSWWTPRRLLTVVVVVAAALSAALLWASQLRRQVRRKTHELATEMRARRDAAIEFQATLRERNRLAANLHDTLLQTLGGIGFQIEACEAEAAAPLRNGAQPIHLPVARRMLDHAVDELRGSVWALRSLPLHGLALPDALRAMAERAGTGHRVTIEVSTEGDLSQVSDFVAGNLLLVTQEAVHNALKHAQAHKISLHSGPAAQMGWVTMTVRDDGRGFAPGMQVGAAQGHFGLTGMRERMERLNGTLRIDSAPGEGTTIHLEVPLRTYDEELA